MSVKGKIADAAAWVAKALRGESAETGVAFAEADLAKWGIKPYYVDDLLKSKALRLVTYRDMLRDPVVKAGYLGRVFDVMACDWDLRPAGYDERRRGTAEEADADAADFQRWLFANMPGAGALQLFFDLAGALVDGYAVVEIVLEAITRGKWAGKVGLRALKAKDVDTWDFDVDEFLNVRGLKQQVQGVWEPRDRSRFIVFSWLSRFANPLGQSEFRAAYRAFWVKDNAWKFRAMYLEALAKGRRKVTYPAEQGDTGREAAERLLERLQESLGFAIPSDLQVELVDLATAPAGVFKEAIADCDKEIVVGLTGATLQVLEGAETGALRATETHRRTSRPWGWVLGEWIAAAIQSDLVAPLHALNFAREEPPTFYWRWEKEAGPEAAGMLERLQRMGLAIPAWYVREQFDVPGPEDDDEVLEPAPAVPGMGAIFSNREGPAAEFADPTGAERRALEKVPAAQRALARTILGEIRKKKA